MSYEQNLIEDEAGIRAVVQGSKRVAVLGIKTEQQGGQPVCSDPGLIWPAHASSPMRNCCILGIGEATSRGGKRLGIPKAHLMRGLSKLSPASVPLALSSAILAATGSN